MQDEERNSCAPASHPHGQRDPPILFHSMTGFPHRIASRPAKSAYSTPTRHLTSGYLRQWGSALRYAGSYTRRPSAMGAARARLRASLPRRARLAPLRSPPRQSPMSTAVLRERHGCWDPAPEQDCRRGIIGSERLVGALSQNNVSRALRRQWRVV